MRAGSACVPNYRHARASGTAIARRERLRIHINILDDDFGTEFREWSLVFTRNRTVALFDNGATSASSDQIDMHTKLKMCKQFTFDDVLDERSSTYQTFERTGAKAVQEALRCVSAIVFAYDQTGSGKTYSLLGKGGSEVPQHCKHDISKAARPATRALQQ
jgi:hypothetical protein